MKLKDAETQAEHLDFSNAKDKAQAMAAAQDQAEQGGQAQQQQPAEQTDDVMTPEQAAEVAGQNSGADSTNQTQEQPTPEQVAQAKMQETQQVAQDIQATLAENGQLKAQLAQMQQATQDMSNANEAAIVEEAMKPPTLNVASLIYADEKTQQQAVEKYNTELAAYNNSLVENTRNEVMGKMQPVLDKYNSEKTETERQAVLNELTGMKGFEDIKQYEAPIRNLITNNDVLKNISDPVAQTMTAYTMVRGLNSMKKTGMTADQFSEMYDGNKEFQDAIEKKRIAALNNSQQVPPLSASQGASNSALNIPNKPKTIDEATQFLRSGKFGR